MAAKKGNKQQKGARPQKKKGAPEEVAAVPSPYSPARIKQFLAEVQGEYRKIAWPEKKVVFGSTGVVIVLVVVISLYLGAVDLLIGNLVSSILK